MMTFALHHLASEPCGYSLTRVHSENDGFTYTLAHPSRSQVAHLKIGRGEPDALTERPTCEAFSTFTWPSGTQDRAFVSLDLLKSMNARELDRFDAKLELFLRASAILAGEN